MNTTVNCIFIAILSFLFLSCKESQTPQKQPNIILIITDDQGYADLSAYDHVSANCQTLSMDRIAQGGVLFNQCYVSDPVCSPSRAAIYTGKYQERWDEKMGWETGLPVNVPTLAETLQKNGYTTARIGKSDYGRNYHNPHAREFPMNHGYEHFLGFSAHAHDYFLLVQETEMATPDPYGHSASLGRLFRDTTNVAFENTYTTHLFTDEAIRFVTEHKDTPFFLEHSWRSHRLIARLHRRKS